MQHATHLPQAGRFPALVTTSLAERAGQARWLPEARRRRPLTATLQRLAIAMIMVATFVLGTAVMIGNVPSVEQTGQPLAAPAGLDL